MLFVETVLKVEPGNTKDGESGLVLRLYLAKFYRRYRVRVIITQIFKMYLKNL